MLEPCLITTHFGVWILQEAGGLKDVFWGEVETFNIEVISENVPNKTL